MSYSISAGRRVGRDPRALLCIAAVILMAGGPGESLAVPGLVETNPEPVLQAFEDWANRFASVDGTAGEAQMLPEGRTLARERRARFHELIRANPQRALAAAIPHTLRGRLPSEIQDELETEVSGTGDLSVIGTVPRHDGPQVEPIQRFAFVNGKRYRVFSYGNLLAQPTRKNLHMSGVALDDLLALDGEAPRGISPAAVPAVVPSVRRLLIIRVDFSDLPGEPGGIYTVTNVQQLMEAQIVPFVARSSYGTAALAYTVTSALYRLPQTAAFYAKADPGYEVIVDAQEAARLDYNLADYDAIAVLFSWLGGLPGSQITYGGMSEIGGRGIWINGELDFRVMVHGLGHNFGLWHARLWQVIDGNPISPNGFNVEYGDDYDPMGANFDDDLRTDYNPWFKSLLGWIPPERIQNITSAGIYRVHRFDSASASGTLALKIAKDGIRNYWVSCRRNFTDNPSIQHGAYVVWGYNLTQGSSLLNLTTPAQSDRNAALALGATLTDDASHIRISPVGEGGQAPDEYMDINITFGSPRPVITSTPQDQLVTAGETALFAVQVVGNPQPGVQWQLQSPGSSTWTNLSDGWNCHGSSSSILTIGNSSLALNGAQLRCLVTNSFGSITSGPPAVLTVIPYGFTTLAGSTALTGPSDGIGPLARFNHPQALAVDRAGNLFVADTANSVIRKITSGSLVTTVAGCAGAQGSLDGNPGRAQFYCPNGIALDGKGNLYVADTENQTLRKVSRSGIVSTLAGLAGSVGSSDGHGSDARFCFPLGITVDAAENAYVTCQGSSTLRKVTPQGDVTTLAGLAGNTGHADGQGAAAEFLCPNGIAAGPNGELYVADQNNSTIRKITADGMVSTLAGLAGVPGTNDGPGLSARFNFPAGVALDGAGNLYIADFGNSTIRRLSPDGHVSTFAGAPAKIGFTDGLPTAACFNRPNGVAVDAAGNVYVADTGNSIIRRYAPLELAPPRLQCWSAHCGLVLCWSSLWQQYSLEQQATLEPGGSWTPVPAFPANVDGMFFFTNSPDKPFGLFRLRKQ